MLVFDIESDGLLDTVSTIHCINVIDRDTGKRLAFNGGVYRDGSAAQRDGTIPDGLELLAKSDALIAGHKIIGYDLPALRKIYPWFKPKGEVFDSLVACSVIWTDLFDRDLACIRSGKLPHDFQKNGYVNSQSLGAWGWRLGVMKGDFNPKDFTNPETGKPHTWASVGFTQEMDKYGRQDPEVNLRLIEKIESKGYSKECLEIEHAVAHIIFRQHERGFAVSVDRMQTLTAKLQRRLAELDGDLQKTFPAWWAPDVAKGTAVFVPKKDNKKQGYTGGAPFSRVKDVVFNAASRDHMADRLTKLRGWEPATFTDGGKPQVDETVLDALPWPEAKQLAEYLTVEKRLGQVSNGAKSWLSFATDRGIYGSEPTGVMRIHGVVNTNGAITGRMTHNSPNVTQTPANHAPYGVECRACWIATPGLALVGADAEGIELRALAHYMAKYDNGAYAETVVNGNKTDGTDVHTVNQRAIRLNTRDGAKTWVYAMLYGAGEFKLGLTTYDDFTEEQRNRFNAKYPTKRARGTALKNLGASRRKTLMENLPALGQLIEAVKHAVKTRGYLVGLDGRLLHVRSEHAALNTLLQSAGAVILKKALVLFEDDVVKPLRTEGALVEPVGNIHDEAQVETQAEHAEEVGKGFCRSIEKAGEYFKFRCKLSGSYSTGEDWSSTH